MKSKGFAPIIILILLVLVAGGVYYFGVFKNKSASIPVASVQPSSSPIVISTPDAATANWKTYNKTEDYISYTSDWYDYATKELNGKNLKYEFQYPSDWIENSGVFTDSQKNKVAEILPGVVSLASGQKCFDNLRPTKNLEDNSELVDQKNINLSGMIGVLKIDKFSSKVIGGDGERITGYSYKYCLMFNDKAFVMAFYDHSVNSESQKLFNQILSTFKFTQ